MMCDMTSCDLHVLGDVCAYVGLASRSDLLCVDVTIRWRNVGSGVPNVMRDVMCAWVAPHVSRLSALLGAW